MTENGIFVLGGPATQPHDILRSEGAENIGESPVRVGGRGPSDARFSRTYARVRETLGSN